MEKWDPLKDIFPFRERMNKLFQEIHVTAGDTETSIWMPTVDVYETAREFVVNAELPEVKESDIRISVEGSALKISGERRLQREGKSYHQVERSYGPFSRTFMLPADVEPDAIRATLNDGILKVIIPKHEKEMPKHIEIK